MNTYIKGYKKIMHLNLVQTSNIGIVYSQRVHRLKSTKIFFIHKLTCTIVRIFCKSFKDFSKGYGFKVNLISNINVNKFIGR